MASRQEIEDRLTGVETRVGLRHNRGRIRPFEHEPSIPTVGRMRVLASFQEDGVTTVVLSWETPDDPDFETVELWVKDLSAQASGIVKVSETREPPATLVLEADADSAKTIIGRTRMRSGQGSDFQASPTVTVTINKLEVTGASLADGSVTEPKIANLAVTNAKIDNLAVNDAKIADLTVEKLTGTLISGKTYVLTSSPNTMRINGTDGFRQENTTSGRDIQLKDGQIRAINPSSITVFEADADGGLAGGQANSGAVTLRNSSGTLALNAGIELAGTGGFVQMSGIGGGNVGCLVRAGSITNAGMTIDGQKIYGKNKIELRDSSGGTVRILLDAGAGRFELRPTDSITPGILMDVGASTNANLLMRNSSNTVEIDVEAKAGSNLGDSIEVRNSSGSWRIRAGVIAAGAESSLSLNSATAGNEVSMRTGSSSLRGVYVAGTRVVATQGATVSDPTGGGTIDSEARTAINAIIDRLQAHGLIA